jgi:hypothetical protein
MIVRAIRRARQAVRSIAMKPVVSGPSGYDFNYDNNYDM